MENKYETDIFPVIKAKWFKDVVDKRKVRVIVIHTMEAPKKADTAENVAKYFKTTNNKVSAHLCIDNDSIVQCVYDNDVAYAAPGVNHDGIQLELAGFANQTAADWKDAYNTLLLEKAANAAAQYCLKYDIPRVHLTDAQLKNGKKGIIGHYQATKVYPPNAGHTDPGPNFPWDFFIERVEFHYTARKKKLDSQ
jgi:N-acetyl-anhydromuramyl-L-alanine amidase AmpD